MDYGIIVCSKCGKKYYQIKVDNPVHWLPDELMGWRMLDKDTYWETIGLWNKGGPK